MIIVLSMYFGAVIMLIGIGWWLRSIERVRHEKWPRLERHGNFFLVDVCRTADCWEIGIDHHAKMRGDNND